MQWLWGGYSVDNPTLSRFYNLHFFIIFLIVGVVILHIVALHTHGSNNPLGHRNKKDLKIAYHFIIYTVKDFFGLGVALTIF